MTGSRDYLHDDDLDRRRNGQGRGPEEGLAEAIGDLTDQTRALVQSEVAAARSEMWEKARASAPALALVGVSAALGLGAAASGYRWTMRLLEKMVPPAAAAAFGTAFYGAGALLTALVATERLRDIPARADAGGSSHH